MNLFQLMMLGAAAFFAYKVYEHVQTLQDPQKDTNANNDANSDIDNTQQDEYLHVADKALETQNFTQAIESLKSANDVDTQNVEVLNKLAYAYAKEGDTRNALKYYENSLAIDDSDDVTHLAFASLLKEIHEYAKAEEHYLRAIEIDDAYEISYFNYANLLIDMDRNDEAKEMYKKAIKVKPDFNQAKFELEKLS